MKKLPLIIAILLTMLWGSFAMADDLADAKALIQNNVIESYQNLSAPDIDNETRKIIAVDLLEKYISFPAVARLSVGNYWRQMNPAQQKEYEALFQDWLKFSLTTRLLSLDFSEPTQLVISNAYQTKRTSVVATQVTTGDSTIVIQWHLRKFKDGIKIIDLVIEDISLVQAQRAEFSAVIAIKGIAGFLDTLKAMTSQIK